MFTGQILFIIRKYEAAGGGCRSAASGVLVRRCEFIDVRERRYRKKRI